MTTKHLLEGVMQWTGARNHHKCALLLELEQATVSRMARGKYTGMRTETLDQIQRISGVPIEMLFAWYRLPEDARLGRVIKEAA